VLTAVAGRRFGSRNLGIVNCRPVRGGKADSLHSEGRASDLGHLVRIPAEGAAGDRLAALLVQNAHALGVQCVIWNRRIWSSSRPTWRPYGGPNPHTDHLHVELTWAGARSLTEEMLERAFGGGAPVPVPPRFRPWRDEMFLFWHDRGLYLAWAGKRYGPLWGPDAEKFRAAGLPELQPPDGRNSGWINLPAA